MGHKEGDDFQLTPIVPRVTAIESNQLKYQHALSAVCSDDRLDDL